MSLDEIDYKGLRARELRDGLNRGVVAGAGAGVPEPATQWTADGGFQGEPEVRGTDLGALARDFGDKPLTGAMIEELKAEETADMLVRNANVGAGAAVDQGYSDREWSRMGLPLPVPREFARR